MFKTLKSRRNQVVFSFGFLLGISFHFYFSKHLKPYNYEEEKVNNQLIKTANIKNFNEGGVSFELYETELAEKLRDDIKIVCWINMAPKYHKTKAVHIKNTWGRHCNKLLFMSHEDDPDLPAIKLSVPEGIDHYWKKFKLAFEYVFKNHLNDGDFFMKADDDTFIVMENLRHMLYQYRPQTALFFGHRYARKDSPAQGYMQGGCYVMSKKLLTKFVTKLATNLTLCGPADGYYEDIYMGRCLANWAIFVDERDDKKQKRFLSYGLDYHLTPKKDLNHWYFDQMFYDVEHGLNCCSETMIEIHNVKNEKEIYLLEYLVYHVDVFGIDNNENEKLPRRLSVDELLEMANIQSNSKQWIKHEVVHQMDPDEFY